MRLGTEQSLYVRSMGKALRVTAIAFSDKEANDYMSKHPDEAVVAVFGELVFIANVYDRGVKIDG